MSIRKTRAELEVEKRAALRERVRVAEHLDRIDQLSNILDQGWERVADPLTGQTTTVPLDNARRQQIDSAIAAKMRLVDKVLPQLKSEEITGAGGESLGGNRRVMAELELRNRLRSVLTTSGLILEHQAEAEDEDTAVLEQLPRCLL